MYPVLSGSGEGVDALDFNPESEVRQRYAEFSASELEGIVMAASEDFRDRVFLIGDVCLEFLARSGSSSRKDRRAVIKDVASHTGSDFSLLLWSIRVAAAFPPSERAKYPDKPISWHRIVTERTALPGDTPEKRLARTRETAEQCAEMNTRETREFIEAAKVEVGVSESPFLDEESPLALQHDEIVHERVPVECIAEPPVPVSAIVTRIRDGLALKIMVQFGIEEKKAQQISALIDQIVLRELDGATIYLGNGGWGLRR